MEGGREKRGKNEVRKGGKEKEKKGEREEGKERKKQTVPLLILIPDR